MANGIRRWFLHMPPRKLNGLLQELLDCDRKRRVDYREGLAKKIESDMKLTMNQLGQLIEKEDPVFKGSMMQCGSSYNQTKVWQPDEMDFAFHWDLSKTRSENILGTNISYHGLKEFERLKRCNVLPETLDRGILPVDRVDMTFSIKSSDNPGHVVNDIRPSYIHERFCKAVNDALMKLTLLPDWEHGGFASPDCTGTRKNGVALMMQFNYNLENGEKLKLTVDLVLAIDLREIYDGDLAELCVVHMGPTWQQEFLKKTNFLDKVLTKIHHSVFLDSTFAERVWLSTMDLDHPVKIVVRIFKILNQMALKYPDPNMRVDSALFTVNIAHMLAMKNLRRRMANYAASEDKEHSRKFATSKLRRRPVKQLQYYDMKVPEGERFVEVGEFLGQRPYLKSHVFQSVVLTLYTLRCTQHPDITEDKIWSKDDVPTIVTNVMMVVQRFLDEAVDEDPDSSGLRSWHFPQIQLESEGSHYGLYRPESLCLDVYRGETVKQHFARMCHLFQQLANQQGANENVCESAQADTTVTGQKEVTPPVDTDEKVVHLIPLDFPKYNHDN